MQANSLTVFLFALAMILCMPALSHAGPFDFLTGKDKKVSSSTDTGKDGQKIKSNLSKLQKSQLLNLNPTKIDFKFAPLRIDSRLFLRIQNACSPFYDVIINNGNDFSIVCPMDHFNNNADFYSCRFNKRRFAAWLAEQDTSCPEGTNLRAGDIEMFSCTSENPLDQSIHPSCPEGYSLRETWAHERRGDQCYDEQRAWGGNALDYCNGYTCVLDNPPDGNINNLNDNACLIEGYRAIGQGGSERDETVEICCLHR